MSKIIKITAATVKSSQDFLKQDTISFIKENYEKGNLEKLPPTPIVREFLEGEYIAIDGHNLLAFYCLKNMDCNVFVAENKNDGIAGDLDMVKKRNKDLFEKYDTVIGLHRDLSKKGINTIADLCTYTNTLLE